MSTSSTNWPYSRAQVADLFQTRGIQCTQQRLEIALLLFRQPQHMSADEILMQVNQTGHVSKATVYNTLGLFAQKGLVREVIVDPSRVFYDSNLIVHHHFYNVDTGLLTDIEPDTLSLTQLPELPEETAIDGIDVIVRIRSTR